MDPVGVIGADQTRSIVSRAASSLPREDQRTVLQTKTSLIFHRVLNVQSDSKEKYLTLE